MKMRSLRFAVTALLVAIPALGGVGKAASYTISMLYGTSKDPTVQASGINNKGAIVGTYSSGVANPAWQMFLYSGGSYLTLSNPPNSTSNRTTPSGVNSSGWIAGSYFTSANSYPNGNEHGFLYCSGSFFPIDNPNASPDSNGTTWTEVHGINDRCEFVGVYRDSHDVFHAYLYSGSNFNAFPDAPQGVAGSTAPYGINNNDEVVGSYMDSNGVHHGFLYVGGTFVALDDPYAVGYTVATGINDNGEVVGWYVNGNGNREGFVWIGGVFTTIDAGNGKGGSTQVAGINNDGLIAGTWQSADGSTEQGFVAALTDLWRDAVCLGGGWDLLSWFGYFNSASAPWIYHQSLGWLCAIGTSTYDIWFWDPAMNAFWWTNQEFFPHIYRARDGAFLYYLVGTTNPEWFYNYNTSRWETYW